MQTPDLNKLTVAQCDEILELTGVDVMAPPEIVSFGRRYAALSFYRRRLAGEKITFADVVNQPVAEVVEAMVGEGEPVPPNRAERRASSARKRSQ